MTATVNMWQGAPQSNLLCNHRNCLYRGSEALTKFDKIDVTCCEVA
jgi:hypothetical protein